MEKTLLESIVSTMLPKEIYQHFEVISLTEKKEEIEMRLEEYPEFAPSQMSSISHIVLDGFCNPIELLHFSIKDKPLYLKLYRRRWKESGSNKHYSNQYDLHPEGVKATHEFASFLKEEVGCTSDEYVRYLVGSEP